MAQEVVISTVITHPQAQSQVSPAEGSPVCGNARRADGMGGGLRALSLGLTAGTVLGGQCSLSPALPVRNLGQHAGDRFPGPICKLCDVPVNGGQADF